ncbi:hypothetical protein BDF20DRAFT_836345 [Mycotypha africana]|uniref:uncharacterized protein n=1 Tax=Mycotypha africana TaxID=64632 RepID=UPI002300AD1C|nr:uncharacterized protein BDF20DRAFT_836345 [Mycotypha africana]KAI8977558.1 hypothetical protein BDF20DRAFT_836345 [Mycotypha africana]
MPLSSIFRYRKPYLYLQFIPGVAGFSPISLLHYGIIVDRCLSHLLQSVSLNHHEGSFCPPFLGQQYQKVVFTSPKNYQLDFIFALNLSRRDFSALHCLDLPWIV